MANTLTNPKPKTSIPFDFLGTITRNDWDNFTLFINNQVGVLTEIEDRIKFLEYEKLKLGDLATQLDLAELNQLKENEREPVEGGIKDVRPDETSTEHFNNEEVGSGGKAPLDEKVNLNPMFRDDADSASLVQFIKKSFIEQIKYRRSYLSYKVYKILDLIEQYTKEIKELETKRDDWDKISLEIEKRFNKKEYWELREILDTATEAFVNTEDRLKGPKA